MARPRDYSEYRGMWMFVMFDLPVVTVRDKRNYSRFRKLLLKSGFTMFQYSVYGRYFASEESGDISKKIVKHNLPPEGQVRILLVTDRQFGKMEVFFGSKRKPVEDPPMQMEFF